VLIVSHKTLLHNVPSFSTNYECYITMFINQPVISHCLHML
jgi:hypothetical protein